MNPEAGALVARLPRTTLVVGKGGVGKTTTAAALALESSRRIGRTLVLTTDPARALPDVLGAPVGADPAPVTGAEELDARLLDAVPLRARFMDRWSNVLRLILDRGTYLDHADIGPLVDTALPGSDEIFAALAIAELLSAAPEQAPWQRIVVDTAPTGHTLRLLQLPQTFRALVGLLDAMQGKHRTMVRALTRSYHADDADAFLVEMTGLVSVLEDSLRDAGRCAAVLVTHPEHLVHEESERYLAELRALGIHVAAVVWNATESAPAPIGDAPQFAVPPLPQPLTGVEGLSRWAAAMRPLAARSAPRDPPVQAARAPGASPASANSARAHTSMEGLLHPLTIVAGKGGVGKTTVAAALAVAAARQGRTLVVSTDPAPSLADALGQPIGDADTPVAGSATLTARQMDASAAFARLRDQYRTRVDALFDGLVGRGMDLSPDRAIMRDLLALAPPGIDEVYALSLMSGALFEQRFERVIVDPAPTGHLLRLLEMPRLALAWTHQLMRVMLKYREVGGLGDAAGDLLIFARHLRALDAVLRDPARAGVVLVTLDEPVVTAETSRLAAGITARGLALAGVVRNRSPGGSARDLPAAPLRFDAPLCTPPPLGLAQLAAWYATWQELT